MNSIDGKSLYGFPKEASFIPQSNTVFERFTNDFMKREYFNVSYLLQHDVPMIIYQGQDDLIVEVPGIIRMVDTLIDWSGAS